jgi:hypothetical protein
MWAAFPGPMKWLGQDCRPQACSEDGPGKPMLKTLFKFGPVFATFRPTVQGVFVNASSGGPIVGKQFVGDSVFPDFTSLAAVEWWTRNLKVGSRIRFMIHQIKVVGSDVYSQSVNAIGGSWLAGA